MFSKIQNFLIPSFLKRFDFWLMTHKPHIWRTRGHFVVFYCSILAAMLYVGGTEFSQNFADFFDLDVHKNNSVVGYFTLFLCFTSVGILMWWWYTIQKFGYRRTNIVHFLTEIGIYTLGIFAVSLFVFAFERGFSHRQAYGLEKHSREDSLWVIQNGYFQYGYMPHFQLNKENDLKSYFKQGEQLSGRMYARQNIVSNVLRQDPKYDPSTNYSGQDPFSLSHWEYPTTEKKYARPPQYKTPADYVNRILTNDTFWKKEEKRIGFKEYANVSREFLTNMTQAEITNLIEEVYPKYFNKIDFFASTQSMAKALLKLNSNKKLFLESLSEQEIKDYKTYLIWLKNNYALYAPQAILVFEKNAGQGFFQKRINSVTTIKNEKDELLTHNYVSADTYFDDDKGELAGEKLQIFLEKLDIASFKTYFTYLREESYQDVDANKNNPKYTQSCQNYFKQYTPKSNLDSLYHYDYFTDNRMSEYTWLYIISDEYAQYVTSKYSEADYTRLRNLLHVNSFEDVYPKSKTPTIQKLLQLHQVDDYNNATVLMNQMREQYESKKYLTFSAFALLYCLLFAIVFYISMQSNGIQFWISAFLAGFFTGFLLFLNQAFPSRYTAYPPLHGNYNYSSPSYFGFIDWNIITMYLFVFLIGLFILIFIFRKTQLSKIQIWFNTIVFSSLFGVFYALDYVKNRVEIRMLDTHPDGYSMPSDEKVRIYSFVLIAAIAVYGFAAWLYKRHLTYPRKQ